MSKGYQANRERQEAIASIGKSIGKRAGFCCEWCAGKNDLRLWDYLPEQEPIEASLALLCQECRELAAGKKGDPNRLRSIRNALWSDVPAVSAGAARALAGCREPWVREAIEESLIDEDLKAVLLKQ